MVVASAATGDAMGRWLIGTWLVLLLTAQAHATPQASASGTVQLEGQPVLVLQSAAGAQRPEGLAKHLSNELLLLAQDYSFDPSTITTKAEPPYVMVGIQENKSTFRPLFAVDERAASLAKTSQQQLADRDARAIQAGLKRYRIERSPAAWLRGTAIAAFVLLGYLVLLVAERRLNRNTRRWLSDQAQRALPEINLGTNRLVSRETIHSALQVCRTALHWSSLALISYLMVPLLLGFFPPTMAIAAGLRSQMLSVMAQAWDGAVSAIPNMLALLLITAITTLVLRANQRIFRALQSGRIHFDWFYPEWARPTSRITTILITTAALALALPYIPGSTSRAFQGAGLFLGVLAALGSSAIATNILSGLMLIYTRGFREGDRVSIQGVIGIVQERALLVTRILTPLNEMVSIPNAMVIASPVINYSLASREINQPVALAACVTIGYDIPWKQVHALLLAAATDVSGICNEPKPVVVQTSLNDFHVSYELNASIEDASLYRRALSDLLAAIQDRFAQAGVEILSPAYEANRDGNRTAIPPQPSDLQ
ncbi:MAG: mechanosensitive ion channel family protein [Vulcanococcus sp.]